MEAGSGSVWRGHWWRKRWVLGWWALWGWLASGGLAAGVPVPPEAQAAAAEADAGAASLLQLEQTAQAGPIAHLPIWSAVRPEAIEPGVRRLLAETEQAFADLEANPPPTWDGLMVPLERLEQRLDKVMGAIGHLMNVKYSDELKAAQDAVRPDYVKLLNRMGQSRAVYDAMSALRDDEAAFAELTVPQKRILKESIRAMERAGVHLDEDAKARYREIQQRLAELSDDFTANLVKQEESSRIKVTEPERVSGVPQPVLELAAKTAQKDGVQDASAADGPWHFVVNGPNYVTVIQQGQDRSLREEFYRAYRGRGTAPEFDNRPIVVESLQLRQELAALLGFPHFAGLSLDNKMAPRVEAVWELFGRLESAARPVAEREYEDLREFMRSQGAAEAKNPKPWDIAFWTERLQEARYGYDEERLREYFQMPRVFDGLFALVERLYGLRVRRAAADAVPVWDESVRFFEVLNGQGEDAAVIAGLYVDPYARPGEKRGGAWMNTVVDRSRLLAGDGRTSSLPVALFVMNARPPAEGAVGLMSLDEVRTLFHEFGHAMQHMFTDIEEGGASGLNLVEWDAVELASQFNEYWMDHKPFLRGLTAHKDSGEPLDEATLERIVASRNFMAGNATLRQLQFGKADMRLHSEYGLPGAGAAEFTPFEMEERIASATVVMPRLVGETMLPSFGHLFSGGYAAGYYSYKWAEVLAADAFAAFREVGLNNDAEVRKVAARFRDTVLALGGSRPAGEIYRQFRGRDADPEALLIEQGLAATVAEARQ